MMYSKSNQLILVTKKKGEENREQIIDMSGRERRVLYNYDSITSQQHEQFFSLNELTHHLDLMIEQCEQSMICSPSMVTFKNELIVK